MKRKACILALSIVLSIAFSGCTSPFQKNKVEEAKKEEYIPVEVEDVSLGEIYDEISISGRFFSEKDSIVLPQIPGEIKSIEVKPGDKVKSGDLLFVIENEEVDKQVNMAKEALDDLKSKKNEIEKAKSQLPSVNVVDGANEERTKKMVEIEGKKEELDKLSKELDGKLSEVENGYKQAKDTLEKLKVRATTDGVVSSVNIKEGGFATNSELAMMISDFDNMYVEINVVDKLLNKIKKDDEVFVDIPSLDKKNVVGKIEYMALSPNVKTGLYPIKITVDTKDLNIPIGALGKVTIKADKREDVVTIPNDAVLDIDDESVVYIVKNGKAKKVKVVKGLDGGDNVEIKSGLKGGEKLIVKGQYYVSDGTTVKVVRGEGK
ncbi:efflux RND transporter periplasmic adaptor subunit [Sporanaerobacter acetigenes]|uniref:efflux RND transporter periplasmic adaptor subunit n=1 Tax=Sporanaerobacter acetigenes TaxID=165813 RepID=UPI00104B6E57|nr:efflux RND transporter periplasmic adaptor subunit [Sporanaerobacter acetigenes]